MTSIHEPGRGAPITGLWRVAASSSPTWRQVHGGCTAALGLVPFAEDLDAGYVALRHGAARIVVVLTHSAGAGDDAAAPPRAGPGPSGVRRARRRQSCRRLGPRTSPMPASIMRASSWRADTPHSNSGIPTASPLNWWRREGGRPRGDPGAAESVSEDDRSPVRSSTAPRTRLVSDTGQCRLRALLGWADVDVPGALGAVPRPALRRRAPPPAVFGAWRGAPTRARARPELEGRGRCRPPRARQTREDKDRRRGFCTPVATIVVPPVFVLFFSVIAVSALQSRSGRAIGIVAAAYADSLAP